MAASSIAGGATARTGNGPVDTTVGSNSTAGKGPASTGAEGGRGSATVTVGHSAKNDLSPKLRTVKPIPFNPKGKRQATRVLPLPVSQHKTNQKDTAVQTKLAAANMPATQLNFEGIDFPGVICSCAPPDTNGEVGATQYVQIVNMGLEVFDKSTGNSVLGPISIASLWSGFGGVCETSGEGDPVVLYDQLANRWVVSQFAGTAQPTHECVAVSTSQDATGSWNRYDFDLGSAFGNNFYDYPKLGVWPDAYYMSMNVFNASGSAFLGPQPFAMNRAAMLAGNPATIVSTGVLGASDDQLMPADMEGSIQPPAGAPNPFTEIGTNPTWKLWRFHVDFADPGSSAFTLGGTLTPDPFNVVCGGSAGACVPQAGVPDHLDTLGDRSMFRNAYRRFPDGSEALVGNMTVDSNGVGGIHWWQIDNATSGTPGFVQHSTYQPDNTWRWMGSAAMDASGDLAIGFSASSSSINPQIRYAGRLAGDPLNTLGQGEATLFAGAGSQTDSQSRWGDYSDLTVDPSDDCTFWYTNEYYQTTSSFDWRTRIADFKFPNCTAGPSGRLDGTVTNESNGNPVAGATVAVTSSGGGQSFGSTTTDASGRYSIDLPVGAYDVKFSAFGYATDTKFSVQITDGDTTTINVALQPLLSSATVRGTISDGSGQGWPLYTRISVAGDPNSPFFTDPITGHYSMQLPAGTSYDVTFTSQLSGYQVVHQTLEVAGDMTHDVAIPVTSDCTAPGYSLQNGECAKTPGGLVEGNVYDLNTGDPINNATVRSNDKPAERTQTSATPDDPGNPDGFYWLFSSLTGPHPFTVSSSLHSANTETVIVPGHSIVQHDFRLAPSGGVQEVSAARYNGPGNSTDTASAIAVDAAGDVYVTGGSIGAGTNFDYATIKYDAAGQEQWVARYNGPASGDDEATAIAVDSEGNAYVTGLSMGSGTGYDYATVKYDAAGEEQWVARYNSPANSYDAASAIAVDATGNVYVTGTSSTPGTLQDWATVKYSPTGEEHWATRYNGPVNGYDTAHALALDSSGNVYVTGNSVTSGSVRTANYDYATIKYNSSGEEQWVARYDGPATRSYDEAYAIAIDSSANVYVTGASRSTSGQSDYGTVKYNSAGQEQWVARYNGPASAFDEARAIAVDSSGNVYVTGRSTGSGTNYDYATIKYDTSGAEEWLTRYNGPGNYIDEAYGLAVDDSGNVYVTGQSYSSTLVTDIHYATLKYDAAGAEQWVVRSNGPATRIEGANAMAIDGSGNVYVTGESYGLNNRFDYLTLKYVPFTLSAGGHWVRGVQTVDLTWDPSGTSTNIDVYRDGALVVTVPNTGAYTDSIGARAGNVRYTYQVCDAGGTQDCSNPVTVRFGSPP